MSETEPQVSVCIPVYAGVKKDSIDLQLYFLKQLLESILRQTYTNIEVVISDQSGGRDIKDFVDQWKSKLRLSYIVSTAELGQSGVNLNNALCNARGEFIKIMFQDDFLYDSQALFLAVEKMREFPDKMWGCLGIICTDKHSTIYWECLGEPRYNEDILIGNNTLGSPSVLILRSSQLELFEENLLALMDCEYYYRLHKRFGGFFFVGKNLVANRVHEESFSSYYKKDVESSKQKDLLYLSRKYDVQV